MKSFEERIKIVAGLLTGHWQSASEIHARTRLAGAEWSADSTKGALNRLIERGQAVREMRNGKVPGWRGEMVDREVWCYRLTT